jgi:hypothetical protein
MKVTSLTFIKSSHQSIKDSKAMTIKQNKHSTVKATKQVTVNGKVKTLTRYLSQRDEEKGLDISMDLQGWSIVAL